MTRAAVMLLLGVLTLAPRASAEEAWDEARQHYERGRSLEAEGNLADALQEYQRAQELRPTFRLHLPQGRVCRGLGRYREALEHFQTFLREGGEVINAAERDETTAAIAELEARVSRIDVRTIDGATISIDGVDLGTAPLSGPVVLDPGSHRIDVRLDGRRTASRELLLERGQMGTVEIDLEAEPASSLVVTPPPAGPEPLGEGPTEVAPEPEREPVSGDGARRGRRRVHRAWFWSLLALSTAALAGGVVFGALAVGSQGDFDDLDVPGRSAAQEAELQRVRDRGYRYANGADAMIFSGIGLGLATLVLGFFTDFRGEVDGGPALIPAGTPTLDDGAAVFWRGGVR
jgi:hypothetical protein